MIFRIYIEYKFYFKVVYFSDFCFFFIGIVVILWFENKNGMEFLAYILI